MVRRLTPTIPNVLPGNRAGTGHRGPGCVNGRAIAAVRITSRTSSTWETHTNSTSSRSASGKSSRSGSLRSGAITRLIPARWAASAFSFRPPIGSTLPASVTSPVIAVSARTGRP